MFHVPSKHVKRISFASRLFPKLKTALNLNKNQSKPTIEIDLNDGEHFCGGRSKNKDLLTFFGSINDPNNGCAAYTHLPTFRRSLKKLTNLVEQELECYGAQEVLLPTLVPQKLWLQSERLKRQPDALDHVYNFTDRAGLQLLLGPTFEESITCLVRKHESTLTESELPLLLYQTSSKFRYESNPKFGLLRSNEFIMNDLYSFDTDLQAAENTYSQLSEVYEKIFAKLSLNCLKIASNTGGIGGSYSHEYQVPLDCGQDTVLICENCSHAFNLEMYQSNNPDQLSCIKCGDQHLTRHRTLELGHTFLLSDVYSKPLNATFVSTDPLKGKRYFQMGCYGLGLTRILGAGVDLFSITPESEVFEGTIQLRWPSEVEPFKVAIVTPAKRSQHYQAGSTEFTTGLALKILDLTRTTDILIEDRDKDGIGKRLKRVQSIGIPHIIVIGNRFIQDRPEVELQTLDTKKQRYSQTWLTEDLILDYFKRLDM